MLRTRATFLETPFSWMNESVAGIEGGRKGEGGREGCPVYFMDNQLKSVANIFDLIVSPSS